MEKLIRAFSYVSFIKYPIMLAAVYFAYKPVILGQTDFLTGMNTALILIGVGFSLDSLKDYEKDAIKFLYISAFTFYCK